MCNLGIVPLLLKRGDRIAHISHSLYASRKYETRRALEMAVSHYSTISAIPNIISCFKIDIPESFIAFFLTTLRTSPSFWTHDQPFTLPSFLLENNHWDERIWRGKRLSQCFTNCQVTNCVPSLSCLYPGR